MASQTLLRGSFTRSHTSQAFLSRKPTPRAALRIATMALSQDELKKQVRGSKRCGLALQGMCACTVGHLRSI